MPEETAARPSVRPFYTAAQRCVHTYCGGEIVFDCAIKSDEYILAMCPECGNQWRVTFTRDIDEYEEDQLEIPFEVPLYHRSLPSSLARIESGVYSQTEEEFARQWEARGRETLHVILSDAKVPKSWQRLDQRTVTLIATVVQWLGTNIGYGFLRSVLKACGEDIGRMDGVPRSPQYRCPMCSPNNYGANAHPMRVKKLQMPYRSYWVSYHVINGKHVLCPHQQQMIERKEKIEGRRRLAQAKAQEVARALTEPMEIR